MNWFIAHLYKMAYDLTTHRPLRSHKFLRYGTQATNNQKHIIKNYERFTVPGWWFKQLSALSVLTASIYQLTHSEAHAYNSLKCAESYMV